MGTGSLMQDTSWIWCPSLYNGNVFYDLKYKINISIVFDGTGRLLAVVVRFIDEWQK